MDTWKASAPLKSSNICLQKYVAFPEMYVHNCITKYTQIDSNNTKCKYVYIYNAYISGYQLSTVISKQTTMFDHKGLD